MAACVFKHQQSFPLLHFSPPFTFLSLYPPCLSSVLPVRPAPSSNTPSPSLIYSPYPLPVSHPSRCPFASSCSLRPSPSSPAWPRIGLLYPPLSLLPSLPSSLYFLDLFSALTFNIFPPSYKLSCLSLYFFPFSASYLGFFFARFPFHQ